MSNPLFWFTRTQAKTRLNISLILALPPLIKQVWQSQVFWNFESWFKIKTTEIKVALVARSQRRQAVRLDTGQRWGGYQSFEGSLRSRPAPFLEPSTRRLPCTTAAFRSCQSRHLKVCTSMCRDENGLEYVTVILKWNSFDLLIRKKSAVCIGVWKGLVTWTGNDWGVRIWNLLEAASTDFFSGM